jgi:aldehyde dehydrogenase (NAD+)
MKAAVEAKAKSAENREFTSLRQRSLELRSEPLRNRRRRLEALREWIHNNQTALHQAVFADLKKPEVEFKAIELLYVLNEIKMAVNSLEEWCRPKPVDATLEMLGTRSYITYEPRGVCLVISPWNYPFSLCVSPLISALAAGNTVMLKPSEMTPHVSAEIKRMGKEVFDPSIVTVVEGGPEISGELLKLPFDHIFFTGSPKIGKIVMKAAAENLASLTLELGGKSPAIVTRSAKLRDAVERIAVSKFVNAGQTCVAPDYVLVEEAVVEEFIQELENYTRIAFADKSQFPKIVSRKHFDRLNELMEDAVESGASIVLNQLPNHSAEEFYPTILRNVSLSSRLMQEEIFGPILPVLTFTNIQDAIAIINSKPKPLGLYFFSQSKRERELILKNTTSGGVCINDCSIQFLHNKLPFGGVNTSGFGKSHGYAGFLTFSNEKPVLKQRSGFTSVKILYPPYTGRIQKLLNTFIKLFYR